ncbi:(2Fe-2S)-binding protein [Catenulispora pinisilvae]|uniref:(2Fe-2S)-binding protein n=1 Tax=Catenulispora pinisilvae TaxID=2705253 RepID=UPI0018925DB7|nr:(2Fe-2S)-binding protein [Catenulispora pinisilvae]
MSEELAALGPYFGVEFHGGVGGGAAEPQTGPGSAAALELVGGDQAGLAGGGASEVSVSSVSAAAPWRPMRELVDHPDALAERVAGVRAFLAAGTGQKAAGVELRVAASVVHLGLVARVVSPLLALAVLHQRCGRVRAADLWWQPTLGSLFPLSLREAALDSGATFSDGVLGGVVGEFGMAIAGFGLSERIVRGNVASALVGAGKILSAARPEVSALMRDLLSSPYLAGSGAFEPDGKFRRRSCCLIYRAAPDRDGALCGDCVLGAARGAMDT